MMKYTLKEDCSIYSGM